MSAVVDNVVRLEPYCDLAAIRTLLREATALGARFRLNGADVEIEHFDTLPAGLKAELQSYRDNGLLWVYLGGEDLDGPSLDLVDALGVTVHLIETWAELHGAIRALIAGIRKYTDDGAIGCDIETAPLPQYAKRTWASLNADGSLAARQPRVQGGAGLSPHTATIATMQIYAGGRSCFVFRDDALQMLLGSHWLRRQHLIIHGATFELKFLLHQCHNYRPPPHRRPVGRLQCSLQATGLLRGVGFGGEARRLDRAAKARLALTVPKDLTTSDWGAARLSPGQLAYAAGDAIVAHRLWPGLRAELHTRKRWAAYKLQSRAAAAVAAMELRGIAFDRDEHTRQVEIWSRDLAQARQQYFQLTGNPPPSTPNEIRTWLEGVLSPYELGRWPCTAKDGLLSISSEALKMLGHVESARPVLEILNREKLLSTFGPSLAAKINPVTSRLHPSFNLAATKAGRFSASDPNFQQVPTERRAPGFRKIFIAAPGYALIGCDFNQVELRALAWLSRNRALTRVYAEGRDLHRETAARIARIAVEAVTDARRAGAKAVNFGCIYGLGPGGLASYAFNTYGVPMTVAEATRDLDGFFAAYPGLKDHLRDHANLCQRRGYIVIGAGRVVEARWEKFGLSYQQCCNLPVQGIAADCMLRALALVHSGLRARAMPGGIIASIHDELVLEVLEHDAEATRDLLQEAMTEACAATFPGAPTNGVATAAIGKTWADLK